MGAVMQSLMSTLKALLLKVVFFVCVCVFPNLIQTHWSQSVFGIFYSAHMWVMTIIKGQGDN